jgi:hypothetical protein
VVIMSTAASISFFSPEFESFLYAPVAGSEHDIHLTVLSALSRLNLDPWVEAAELSALPKDTAAQRLAVLITQIPGGAWANADANGIAHRLIGLLPRSNSSGVAVAKPLGPRWARPSTSMLISIALGLASVVIATTASRDMQASDAGDAPRATRDVPQSLPQ